MYHPSKPRMMSLEEITAIHTSNKVAVRADGQAAIPYPVGINGYLWPVHDVTVRSQDVLNQRGSGFPTEIWGDPNF